MKRQNPEQKIHRAIADYCRVALPREVVWTTFPAGGGGRIRGGILQSLGLVAGVSDMLFMWRGRVYFDQGDSVAAPAIGWLEIKSDKGRLSPEQVAFSNRVLDLGHKTAIARSIDDARNVFALWEIPTRESDPLPRHRPNAPDTKPLGGLFRGVASRKR